MMPISLTLSAFGPYPDTITIDFESFQEDGLFLITGPTGSGKSFTLACCIDYINQTMERHIITLEDPIEFEF